MPIQYEQVWRADHSYYARTRDVDTKEVRIQQIDPVWEFYEKAPSGDFKYVLDKNLPLTQRLFHNNREVREYKGLMESTNRPFYGGQAPEYRFIRENFFGNGLSLDSRIWFFDIEVIPQEKVFPDPHEAIHPVTQMQIYDNYTDKIIILSLDDMVDKSKFEKWKGQLIFKHYTREQDMFNDFFKLLDHMQPTVITAWNGDYFDFPYLTNRAMALDGVNYKKLSPIRKVTSFKTSEGDGYRWEGIYLIDMMQAYKKFVFAPQVSYSLDNIAKVELDEGSGKVDYGEFDNIIDFHHGDIDKFLQYAIKDVEILKNLEDKLKLIALVQILAYMMGINFDDAFGTVKPWSQFLTNLAMQKGMVMPYQNNNKLGHPIVGGFVRHPKKGKAIWAVSIDVNSMYPLLGMRAFNMSPETYIEEKDMDLDMLQIRNMYHRDEDEYKFTKDGVMDEIGKVCKAHDVAFGMNAFFRRDEEGIIPATVGKIYGDRKIAKNKMLMYKALHAKLKAAS